MKQRVRGGRVVAALTLALVWSGCASAPSPTPAPTVTPTPTRTAKPTPTGPPTPGSLVIPGLDTQVISGYDPKRSVDVQLPVIPATKTLQAATAAWASHLGDAFLESSQPVFVAPEQVRGKWTLLLQQWPLVGVRMQATRFAGVLGITVTRSFYTDAATGAVWAGPDLIAPASLPAARQAIVAGLAAAGRPPLPGSATKDAVTSRLLEDVRFDKAGNLVALVAAGRLPQRGGGLVEVTVPQAIAAPWLSDPGRRIQAGYAAHWAAVVAAAGTPQAAGPAPDCAQLRCVALTFDDGPGPYTDLLLDDLEAAGVPATFFEIGSEVRYRGAVTLRQQRLGMAVGTHTFDHSHLPTLSAAGQTSDLARGATAIEAASGVRPTLLRPPYGDFDERTTQLGVPLVLWDTDSLDWESLDAAEATATVLREVKPGSIVLLHDIYDSSVAAVPGLVALLRAQGYTLVTVPQLVGSPEPGRVYHARLPDVSAAAATSPTR